MKRTGASLAVFAALLIAAPTVRAYLKFGFKLNGQNIAVRWNSMPVRYFITNRDVPNVTASQLQAAAQQGFAAWAKVPSVSLSAQFVGFTSAEPSDDGINVIGFQVADLERTLGATQFAFDAVTGAPRVGHLLEFRVRLVGGPNGASGRFDVQSIVTHELDTCTAEPFCPRRDGIAGGRRAPRPGQAGHHVSDRVSCRQRRRSHAEGRRRGRVGRDLRLDYVQPRVRPDHRP